MIVLCVSTRLAGPNAVRHTKYWFNLMPLVELAINGSSKNTFGAACTVVRLKIRRFRMSCCEWSVSHSFQRKGMPDFKGLDLHVRVRTVELFCNHDIDHHSAVQRWSVNMAARPSMDADSRKR